jgi:hypothetical protein
VDEWRLKRRKKDAFVNRVLSEAKLWFKNGDDKLGKKKLTTMRSL